MARSEEAVAFSYAVYNTVRQIPHGKVTSYGHIAALVGTRTNPLIPTLSSPNLNVYSVLTNAIIRKAQRPRQVGICLKHLSQDPESRYNHDNVPWQRVINAKGIISPRYGVICVDA